MAPEGLTFISLFSGIGGLDLGLERAGWTCLAQAENDKWCRQVLRRHWPLVDLYDDVRTIHGSDLPTVDLICGGFPCQDLSVAGRRAGLAGKRTSLFHEFVRIARENGARWLLLENVPGLLSSNDGDDFRTILRELTGYWPAPPAGGWRDSGVCEGPSGRCIWRVLDTQYFGPPQRRERVFLVVDTRAECGPEVLLEPSCVPGHPAAGGEAREEPAPRPKEGAPRAVAGLDEPAETLDASYYKGPGNVWGKERQVVAPTLTERARQPDRGDTGDALVTDMRGIGDGKKTGTLDAIGHAARTAHAVVRGAWGFNWQNWTNDGFAITEEGVGPLDTSQVKAVVPLQNSRATNPAQRGSGVGEAEDPAYTLTGRDDPGVMPTLRGFGYGWQGQHNDDMARAGLPVQGATPRRLTPRECERLQGLPDDWTEWGISSEGEPVEVSDTQRYKQVGNAVTVPVAEWIGRRVARWV